MKTLKTLIFVQFFMFCQLVAAQSADSTVTIKIQSGNFIVSGIVADEQTRMSVVNTISSIIGNKADFDELKVNRSFDAFGLGWHEDFERAVDKIKNWKSGVFVFIKPQTESLPDMPQEIWNAEIRLLPDNGIIKPSDFQNKIVVLFFLEHWCGPCLSMADKLQELYAEKPVGELEIIGVSTEPESKEDLRKLFEVKKYRYKLGLGEKSMLGKAAKISDFHGIPQTFLVRKGKLNGIFIGDSPKVFDYLKSQILKISNQQN